MPGPEFEGCWDGLTAEARWGTVDVDDFSQALRRLSEGARG